MTKDDAQKNRRLAEIAGNQKYMGRPCVHGHNGLRYTRDAYCCQCNVLHCAVRRQKAKQAKKEAVK